MTEEEIRLLICKSQEDGFKALIQQYQKYVFSIVWKRIRTVGNIEDAKECMSDVFAHIFIHFNEINNGSLKGYIATVAERMAINKFKKLDSEKIAYLEDEELSTISDDTDLQDDACISERNKLLLKAIHSLGEPDSTLIIQKYYYERNASDIAEIVGLSPVAVRKRLSRALKKLKKILTDENIDLR